MAAANSSAPGAKASKAFARDLPMMMYGFGDDPFPLSETIKLVEEFARDYVGRLVHEITDCIVSKSLSSSSKQISTEAVLFAVRKDPVKYRRVKELLHMQKQVKKVLAEAKPNVAAPENARAAIAKQESELKKPGGEHGRETAPPAQPAKPSKPKPKRQRKQGSDGTPPKSRKKAKA